MKQHLPLIAACLALLTAGHAVASGYELTDEYVKRYRTDLPLERYQAGELGVVLPSYVRSHLYTAWRDVMLGAQGLKTAPNPAQGLTLVEERRAFGWQNSEGADKVYGVWRDAVRAALGKEMSPPRDADPIMKGYIVCPAASYTFATATLNDLRQRADATPERLSAWVATQREVFNLCGDDPLMRNAPYSQTKGPQPAPLPATAPLYWRQLQEYQLGAAAFYREDYVQSAALFSKIGATEGHPMRSWGDYLSLRAQARAASQRPGSPDQQWKASMEEAQENREAAAARAAAKREKLVPIEAAVKRILDNPALAGRHADSRALGRIMQARLAPAARFAELSKLLAVPANDPYFEDHFGDWLALADQLLVNRGPNRPDVRQAMRASSSLIDWMQTVPECRADGYSNAAGNENNCANERAHALAQWRRYAKEGDAAQARVWLMASAIMATTMPADLEAASLKIAATAPEYLTVRYGLARHYRLSKQIDKARSVSDDMLAGQLKSGQASSSARNLFMQERFAVSATPAEAAAFVERQQGYPVDNDTGEQAGTQEPTRKGLAGDGQRWLNSGLSAAELYALGADKRLTVQVRIFVGVAAWMRFDMLDQGEDALKAARQVEQNSPALAPVMRQYRTLTSAKERRHWMLLNSVKYNLGPMPGSWRNNWEYPAAPPDEATARMWCKMPAKPGADYEENADFEQSPPMPDIGERAQRDRELAQLGALKTATGYLGDHVLQRAIDKPNDPDLPWLLHVVVSSTRGGCLDADASALSKKAFTLLHKRYGKSEWAKKTPYFY